MNTKDSLIVHANVKEVIKHTCCASWIKYSTGSDHAAFVNRNLIQSIKHDH